MSVERHPHILIVAGPTASGKKRFALEAAERLNGEIISADSRKVYRGFDIGTAKPSAADRARIPHHLIDIIDPDDPFSAMDWAMRAKEAVEGIFSRGKLPIISGGTGFYITAFREGLTTGIEADPKIRCQLEADYETYGARTMYERLQECDPSRAAALHENDRVRVLRALEIYQATGGKPYAELAEGRDAPGASYEYISIGADMARETLYRRIDERVDAMIDEGLLNEIRGLLDKGYDRALTAFDTVGYKEWFPFFDGAVSFEQCREHMKRDTRRYAKRQLTWFRARPAIRWIDMTDRAAVDTCLDDIGNSLSR